MQFKNSLRKHPLVSSAFSMSLCLYDYMVEVQWGAAVACFSPCPEEQVQIIPS